MDTCVNMPGPQPTDVRPDGRHWPRTLARYNQPSYARGLFEIAVTVVPLVGLWLLAWAMLDVSYWIALPLALAAGAFVVRLFMIQHDCGHGSFFRHRFANVWIGRLASIVTMTPFSFWKRTHAVHHASSGNLDRRGMGDIDTLTVEEYRARSLWGRLRYRLYRHPLVMFGLGPSYVFLLQYRLPVGMMHGNGWRPWVSTMTTNAVIAAVAGGLIWLIGLKPFLMIHLPVAIMAASIGVWLFYVQHQFQGTTWAREGSWNALDAALHGSSHYDLPAFLRWLTANIGMHHLHHLSSRIPYYRLPRVLRDHPELRSIGRLTLSQSLGCVRLALWDDKQHRLVSFREARLAS